ncbi:hypothetical protein SAMN05421740_112138 [Parapedobacter koreensis]|uniref:Protein NO VEIN C-terminal domain-containing protein n=2 Tax=Parapedobacter koreensis TaxID=332977 RepID=A0A1H7TXK2_9SPHI|nr:hypothetical protein SAMN05421740_112138 [Parapedobacter koreensis]
MLTENDIVDLLGAYFEAKGCKIKKVTTKQHGIDLEITTSDGQKTYIEAKGETSANEKSKRYSKPFTKNQRWTHVSVALMKTFVLMCKPEHSGIRFGIALPENHRDLTEKISLIIKKVGIDIYFVSREGITTL